MFRALSVVALAIEAVAAYLRASGLLGDWALLAAAAGCMLLLAGGGWLSRRRLGRRFDLLVAAETLVAFGIASLVAGLVVSLYLALEQIDAAAALDAAAVRHLALPFLEGLSGAALAPLLAVILRNIDGTADEAEETAGPTGVPGGPVGAFAGDPQSGALLTDLRKGLTLAAAEAETFGKTLQAQSALVVTSVGELTRAMNPVTAMLRENGERLRLALLEFEAQAKALSASAEQGRSAVAGLAGGLQGLERSAEEARLLLDALATLVESMERFLGPDSGTPAA